MTYNRAMFNVELIGFTIKALGEMSVGYTAIMVHHRFRKEHRVDDKVFDVMGRESIVGVLGLVLIAGGYVLELWGRL
jgi:hypothetical protein